MSGVVELLSHVWIHADHELALLDCRSVLFLHLLIDPSLERHADDGSTDIDDPLLGDFGQVWIIGKVVGNVRQVADELEDLLD